MEPDFSQNLFGPLHKVSEKAFFELLDLHELWLSSEGKAGQSLKLFRYDLSNNDFSGRDLSHSEFQLCDFRKCKMTNITCFKTKFYRSCFSGAIIDKSQFRHSSFMSSLCKETNFGNSTFDEVNFMYANLTEAIFDKGSLFSCLFLNTELRGISLKESFLRNIDLREWTLTQEQLEGAKVDEEVKFLGQKELINIDNPVQKIFWEKGKVLKNK